jgi:hypothetical protein
MRKMRVMQTTTADSGYEFSIQFEHDDGISSKISLIFSNAAVRHTPQEDVIDVIVKSTNDELEKNGQGILSDLEMAYLVAQFFLPIKR